MVDCSRIFFGKPEARGRLHEQLHESSVRSSNRARQIDTPSSR
ncbi:MAG: hypothetical protein WBA89_23915 [Microcoleus sp.]